MALLRAVRGGCVGLGILVALSRLGEVSMGCKLLKVAAIIRLCKQFQLMYGLIEDLFVEPCLSPVMKGRS